MSARHPCRFVGGPLDGQTLHIPDSFQQWLYPKPNKPVITIRIMDPDPFTSTRQIVRYQRDLGARVFRLTK